MRLIVPMALVVMLSACGGYHSTPSAGEQNAGLPAQGNDATRDGFYDGGVFDPDLTRPGVRLAE